MTRVVEYDVHATDLGSTAITDLWYAGKTQELFLRFKSTGNIAGYKNVPPAVAKAFFEADSIGRYYSRSIKDRYSGTSGDVELRKYVEPKAPTVKDVIAEKRRFKVSGNVLRPVVVEEYVYATSIEDAMAEFRKKHDGAEPEVTGVNLALQSVGYR